MNNHNLIIQINDFELCNEIGSGSFGTVYTIKKIKTGEIYAAKLLRKKIEKMNKNEQHDFKREVNNLAKINHPAVLQFIGYSEKDFDGNNYPVIATEYMPKGSLSNFIGSGNQDWNSTKKLICIYGIAKAMYFLHSKNLIHRDLKPENIFMTDDLYPKIGDFGLSKILHNKNSLTNDSGPCLKGTILYSPPELFAENPTYTKKCDVYAFAFIVYEILTNNNSPFNSLNVYYIMGMVKDNKRPTLGDDIQEPFKKLIERCWSQEEFSRPHFEDIALYIEQNKDKFFSDPIDINEFDKYVEYIKYQKNEFYSDRYIFEPEYRKAPNSKIKDENMTDVHLHSKDLMQYIGEENISSEELAARLKILADKEDSDAMYRYAIMLDNGDKIQANPQEAIKYYKKSADLGNIDAMFNYALMMSEDTRIRRDKKEAERYFQMAADKNNDKAMNCYALMLLEGDGVKKDIENARRYFSKAIKKNNANAMYNYAMMIDEMDSNPNAKKEVAEYLKMAADSGNVDAMIEYATILKKSKIQSSCKEAMKYLKSAADKGNDIAMCKYAKMLYKIRGIKSNKKKSTENKKKSAENKEEADENKKEAAEYYLAAAGIGNAVAMKNYGKMLYNGIGIKQDIKEAIDYFKKSADKQNDKAMVLYADILMSGNDYIKADKNEALRLYKEAANLGNADAMYSCAKILYDGDETENIPSSKVVAAHYFEMAAEKGNYKAMEYYAQILESGIDEIKADKNKANKLYEDAKKLKEKEDK